MRRILFELRADRRLATTAVVATLVAAVLLAIPTVVIPNPFFQRMVPLEGWEVALWLAATPLIGLAFALSRRSVCAAPGRTAVGGILAVFAVGCPTCNALVIAAIGASGAMTYFAPLQPALGIAALAVLVATLRFQARRLDEAADTERSRTRIPR
jgi:hypothetical protein